MGATENEADPFALVKFFTPDGNWTWFAFEFDGDDTFFGFVRGHENELATSHSANYKRPEGIWACL